MAAAPPTWRVALHDGAVETKFVTIKFDLAQHTSVGEVAEAAAWKLDQGKIPQVRLALFRVSDGAAKPSWAQCNAAVDDPSSNVDFTDDLTSEAVRAAALPDKAWFVLKISWPAAAPVAGAGGPAASGAGVVGAAGASGASSVSAGAGAGAGGGPGGSSSIAAAFKQMPDGKMPLLFHALLNSAVVGIYEGKMPVSTAVFFSATRALTAFHDAEPKVGDVLSGASAPTVKPVRKWEFRVVATSRKNDLVVLEAISGPAATYYLPITADTDITSIASSKVWLATFGISAAAKAAEKPNDIAIGSFTDKVRVSAVGKRHFAYHINTGRGDSGGAIISLTGRLLGLHLGGWNDASPPPSPPKEEGVASASAASEVGVGDEEAHAVTATAIKNALREQAMGIAELGSETRKSIIKLARTMSAGGYAIFVGAPAVSDLCGALSSSSSAAGAAGGCGGSAGTGSKRKARDAGLGIGAAGGKKRG